MDSPYLERGESIILTTDRVSINSAQYDVLLTTRYLILVDVRYAQFQPQKIPLLAILSVKGGKTSNGDLVITLYFSDTSLTGSGQMNLIFSQYPGEQRDRERDEWLKNLMERIVAVRQETIGSKTITPEQGIGIRPETRRTIAPEMQPPHTTVIDIRPETVELSIVHDEPESPAPEEPDDVVSLTDVAHPEVAPTEEEPDNIITDAEPHSLSESTEIPTSPDEPVEPIGSEDVSLPDIIQPEDGQDIITDAEPHTPTESSETPTSPEEPVEPISSEDVSLPDVMPPEEEQDIISDTEPHTLSESTETPTSREAMVEPIRSEDITHPDVIHPEDGQDIPITDFVSPARQESSEPSAPPGSAIVGITAEKGEDAEPSETISAERDEPVEPGIQPAADIPPETPGSPPPVVFRDLHKTIIIVIVILILGIAGAVVLYPEYLALPGKEIFPVQNPATAETTVPAPSSQLTPSPTEIVIPPTGVWVRVTYPQNYYGRLGNPGSLRGITGSGDRFYQVNEKNRLVQVQIYKTDNTGDMLTVGIYRNGEIIYRRSITSPGGVIELLIDAETGNPPGIITPGITQTAVPTTPPGSNQTVINPGT